METYKYYFCSLCGTHDVDFMAIVKWDPVEQGWQVQEPDLSELAFCHDCSKETYAVSRIRCEAA